MRVPLLKLIDSSFVYVEYISAAASSSFFFAKLSSSTLFFIITYTEKGPSFSASYSNGITFGGFVLMMI